MKLVCRFILFGLLVFGSRLGRPTFLLPSSNQPLKESQLLNNVPDRREDNRASVYVDLVVAQFTCCLIISKSGHIPSRFPT